MIVVEFAPLRSWMVFVCAKATACMHAARIRYAMRIDTLFMIAVNVSEVATHIGGNLWKKR
jgi:hypothetical protein